MQRAKNSATVQDIVKIVRANGPFHSSRFVGVSAEQMCDNFGAFLEDLLYCTSRPSKAQLEKAVDMVCGADLSKDELQQFVERVLTTVSFCREKNKSMVTGKKLPASVTKICNVIRKVSDPNLAAKLVRTTNKLRGCEKPTLGEQLKKRAKGMMLNSPGPASSSKTSLASSSKPADELDALRKLYGLPVCGKAAVTEILSSQEDSASAAVSGVGPADTGCTFVQYSTPTGMVRLYNTGLKVEGKMVPGPSGFAIAKFGDEVVQTEVPNLLLTLPVTKKPAMKVYKKPACAAISLDERSAEDSEVSEADPAVQEIAGLTKLYGHKALQPKPKPHVFDDGSAIYFTDAAEQCYITMSTPGSKKHLLVSVAAKKSKDFRKIVMSIWNCLVQENCASKEKALELRSRFLG
jgi:hypothetical protein